MTKNEYYEKHWLCDLDPMENMVHVPELNDRSNWFNHMMTGVEQNMKLHVMTLVIGVKNSVAQQASAMLADKDAMIDADNIALHNYEGINKMQADRIEADRDQIANLMECNENQRGIIEGLNKEVLGLKATIEVLAETIEDE